LIDGNHLLFIQEGTLPSGATRGIAQTPAYDHCNFTVLDGGPAAAITRFRELLLDMSYADPQVRRLLDLEGLKRWLPGRTEGYLLLSGGRRDSGYLSRCDFRGRTMHVDLRTSVRPWSRATGEASSASGFEGEAVTVAGRTPDLFVHLRVVPGRGRTT
jgi:hypothetical protein